MNPSPHDLVGHARVALECGDARGALMVRWSNVRAGALRFA